MDKLTKNLSIPVGIKSGSLKQWESDLVNLGTVERHVQFYIGDKILEGEEEGYITRGKYDRVAELTGIEKDKLMQYVSINKAISLRRRKELPYTHHYEVAKLEPKSQEYFLNEAVKNHWSVSKLREQIKEKEKEEERKKQSEEGKSVKLDIDFRLGDFEIVLADIPDNSVDFIITDPPYPREYIECWTKLSRFAAKKLKTHGFCITYSGQLNLPEVIKRMSEYLNYYWMFSLLHTGSRQLINARNIFCGWKPLLIFQKEFKKLNAPMDDFIIGSGREKGQHDWQQAVDELLPIIEKFTEKGDLIIEPFAGGGTTIIAANKLGRNIIAAEIEEETYNIAKNRIHGILR